MIDRELHGLLTDLDPKTLRFLNAAVKRYFAADGNAIKIYNRLKRSDFTRHSLSEIENKGVYLGRLRRFLLAELVRYDERTVQGRLVKLINEARVLLEHQRYAWGYKLLEEALDLAEHYELIEYQLMIQTIHRQVNNYGIIAPERFSHRSAIARLNQLTVQLEEQTIQRNLTAELMQLAKQKHHLSSDEIARYQTQATFKGKKLWQLDPMQLQPISDDGANFHVQVIALANRAKIHRHRSELDAWLQTIDRLIALLKSNPHMVEYRPITMKTQLHDRMRIFLLQERYEEMLDALDDLARYLNEQPTLPSELYTIQYLYLYRLEALSQLIKRGETQHTATFEQLLEQTLLTYKRNSWRFDKQARYLSAFNLALIAFSMEKLPLATRCLNQYFSVHSKRSTDYAYIYFPAMMLEFAIQVSYFVMEPDEFAPSSRRHTLAMIDTYQRWCERKERHYRVEADVVQFCRVVLSADSVAKMRQTLEHHQQSIRQIVAADKHERSYLKTYVHWPDWYGRLAKYFKPG